MACFLGLLSKIKKSARKSATSAGFTIIELLVVVTTIGILSGIIVSVTNYETHREAAEDATKRKNLEKLTEALGSYHEFEEAYPDDSDDDRNPIDTDPDGNPIDEEDAALMTYISIWPSDVEFVADPIDDDYAVFVQTSSDEAAYYKFSTSYDDPTKDGVETCGESGIVEVGVCVDIGEEYTGPPLVLDYIEISEDGPLTLDIDEVINLTATAYFTNGTDSSSSDVTSEATWSEADAGTADPVININSPGVIEGRQAGDTVLVASYTYDSVTKVDTVDIHVNPDETFQLNITPATASVNVGSTVNFNAVFSSSIGGPDQNVTSSASWSILNGDQYINLTFVKGQVYGRAPGTAHIQARYSSGGENYTASATVVVTGVAAAEIVRLDVRPVTGTGGTFAMEPRTTQQFYAYAVYSNNTEQNVTNSATWSSTGAITLYAFVPGRAVTSRYFSGGSVTATYQGFSDTTTITTGSSISICSRDIDCIDYGCIGTQCARCNLLTHTCYCADCSSSTF